jgi:ribonuclease VapC
LSKATSDTAATQQAPETTSDTTAHRDVARAAYRDFGRGSGDPARLNFGDCFAYALAKCADEPLLFKGNDFSHTDLTPADHRNSLHP